MGVSGQKNKLKYNPYEKVNGCPSVYMFMCLFILYDLANRCTDVGLLYSEASYRS